MAKSQHGNMKGLGLAGTNIGANYDKEELELFRAMEAYKFVTGRRFPSSSEVLRVLKSLGWRKVAEPTDLPKYKEP